MHPQPSNNIVAQRSAARVLPKTLMESRRARLKVVSDLFTYKFPATLSNSLKEKNTSPTFDTSPCTAAFIQRVENARGEPQRLTQTDMSFQHHRPPLPRRTGDVIHPMLIGNCGWAWSFVPGQRTQPLLKVKQGRKILNFKNIRTTAARPEIDASHFTGITLNGGFHVAKIVSFQGLLLSERSDNAPFFVFKGRQRPEAGFKFIPPFAEVPESLPQLPAITGLDYLGFRVWGYLEGPGTR